MGNYLCEDSSCEWHDKLNRQGACEYADNGATRCPSWRCDCFIETHPDSPMGLHPEDFIVSLGDLSPIPHY
ncbi:MAG TPA: hypothetical protein VN039_05775, partial [Nitrospira sp.]|nr:hypothetical protein [Nitrospira sp.]